MKGVLTENEIRRLVRFALMEAAGEGGEFMKVLEKAGAQPASEVYSGAPVPFLGVSIDGGLKFLSKGEGKFGVTGNISGERVMGLLQDSGKKKYETTMLKLDQGNQLDVQPADLIGLPRLSLSLVKDSDNIEDQVYAVLSTYDVGEIFNMLKDQVVEGSATTDNKIFIAIRVGGELIQEFPGGTTEPADNLDRIVTWIEKNPQELPYKKGQKVWPYFRNLLRYSLLELVNKSRITIPDDREGVTRAILANLSAFAKKKNVKGGLNDQVKALVEAIPVAEDTSSKSADFGPLTDLATRVFQAAMKFGTGKEFNLDIDGLMGEETIKAMVNVANRGAKREELFNLPPSPAKK
jgi:hypothetical protein